jgi:hypothetical protein
MVVRGTARGKNAAQGQAGCGEVLLVKEVGLAE